MLVSILVTVLLVALVVALVYPVPSAPGADVLGRIGAGVRTDPVLRPVLIIVAMVLALLVWRRWRLARLAYRPGPVEVTHIVSATKDSVPVDEIEARFREALTSVQLATPSIVPGQSAPVDFMSEVRTAAVTARTPLGILAAAIASITVTHAYRVSCVVRTDGRGGRKGLTVHVSHRLTGGGGVDTVWGDTWEAVVDEAASHVAAHILPRTQLARRPPWTSWRGVQLEPALFFHFQEARRLATAGSLEEALGHFEQALQLDPHNPYIRFERAAVQEELGLYVDALAGYIDIVAIEAWYDRRLWRRLRELFGDNPEGERPPSRWARSPSGPDALLLARYRMVCSLAAGSRLAEQWRRAVDSADDDKSPQGRRAKARKLVVNRLRRLLRLYHAELAETYRKSGDPMPKGELEDEHILRLVFQHAAVTEGRALERDYRWSRRRRRPNMPITQTAVRFLPIWAPLQFVTAAKEAPPVGSLKGQKDVQWVARRLGWTGDVSKWAPEPERLARLVGWAFRFKPRRILEWQEHYNAACTCAVGLASLPAEGSEQPAQTRLKLLRWRTRTAEDADKPRDVAELFARHATRYLERAVVATDSQFAASRSPWLRWGDQDLDHLRIRRDFDNFLAHYFPVPAVDAPSPPNIQRLLISGHVTMLLARFGELRARYWEDRQERWPDRDTIASFADEKEWWAQVAEYTRECRHWPVRQKLVAHANRFTVTTGQPAFDSALHDLVDDKRWWSKTGRELPSEKTGNERHEALSELVVGLATERDRELADLAERAAGLEAVVVSPSGQRRGPVLDPPTVAAFAAAWRGVATWMRALTGAETDKELADARDEASTAIDALRAKRSGL